MTEEKVPGSKYVNVLADNISNNNNNIFDDAYFAYVK
jgi:hypothetical protein